MLWWSLCTFVFTSMPGESTSSGGGYAPCIKILLAGKVRVHPLVEFMHLVFTRMPIESTSSGGVYAPCIYSHARREVPQTTQVFVVVFV